MFSKILSFIQYHNAVAIGLSTLFLGVGVSVAAVNPAVQDAFYTSSQVARSVDNSYIRQVDLGNVRFDLKINRVTEDDNAYSVEYSYNTITVKDYMWQPIFLEKTLSVSKKALGEQDLGVYVAQQLGQIIDRDYSYLSRAQTIEREKGPSQKVVTTQYAGLVGRMLDSKDKVFAGYDPVVKPAQAEQEKEQAEVLAQQEEQKATQPQPVEIVEVVKEVIVYKEAVADKDTIQQIVMDYLAQHGTASASNTSALAQEQVPQTPSPQNSMAENTVISGSGPQPSAPVQPSEPELELEPEPEQQPEVAEEPMPIISVQPLENTESIPQGVPATETTTGAQDGVQ